MAAAPETPGAFFGRRKGKKLRQGQDELVRTLLLRLRRSPGQSFDIQSVSGDLDSDLATTLSSTKTWHDFTNPSFLLYDTAALETVSSDA